MCVYICTCIWIYVYIYIWKYEMALNLIIIQNQFHHLIQSFWIDSVTYFNSWLLTIHHFKYDWSQYICKYISITCLVYVMLLVCIFSGLTVCYCITNCCDLCFLIQCFTFTQFWGKTQKDIYFNGAEMSLTPFGFDSLKHRILFHRNL
jgi:hypothetical protein